MDLRLLKRYLGHESIETTGSTYAPKALPEQMVDQLATYGASAQDMAVRAEALREARTE